MLSFFLILKNDKQSKLRDESYLLKSEADAITSDLLYSPSKHLIYFTITHKLGFFLCTFNFCTSKQHMMSDKLVLMKPNHFEIYFFLFGQKKVKKKNLISSLATYAVHQVALKK